MKTQLHKIPQKLNANPERVITLPSRYPGKGRVQSICNRLEAMETNEAEALLQNIYRQFGDRHKHIESTFRENYRFFRSSITNFPQFPEIKKILLGAILTKEYSIQSAALFNPSMVAHPDQSGMPAGHKRFLISLRSVGEGHISSIEFREGIVDKNGGFSIEEPGRFSVTGTTSEARGSDFRLQFPEESSLSERVIFPPTRPRAVGLEDVRLVLFSDEDQQTYYGTYTLYNGKTINTQIFETKDFLNFRFKTLTGDAINDKGMALFPEKINGRYAMISRQGGENISIMFSGDLFNWQKYSLLMEPRYSFEIAQMGNCGSPVKTEKGWLLLTHGVGPMREYTISAALLDLENPARVLSRLNRPLIRAGKGEREGYVPNVVYSCGGMKHGDKLFIPYAMSDSVTGFAYLSIPELLTELEETK